MSKGWTEERRRAQAERCRANKPWEQSTGPKTATGKARVSMNAYKYGGDTQLKALVLEILRHNRAFVKSTKELAKSKLIKSFEKQLHIRGRVADIDKTK